MRNDYVEIDIGEIIQETDAAFLVMLADGKEIWLPKSQIRDAAQHRQGQCGGTMEITEWIADQKGLDV